MRRVVVTTALLLFIGACGSSSSSTLPPSTPALTVTTTPTSSSTGVSTSSTAATPRPPTADTGSVSGALPDGRAYIVTGLDRTERALTISAPIYAFVGPELYLLGIIEFQRGQGPQQPTWVENTLVVAAGEWTVSIEVYDYIVDAVFGATGELGRDVLIDSVRGYSVLGMPVLDLSGPLSFAADRDAPTPMEVRYETFVVRRGCQQEPWVACSDDFRVQALPLRNLLGGDYPTPPSDWAIESTYTGEDVQFQVLAVSTKSRLAHLGIIEHATTRSELDNLWFQYGFDLPAPTVDLNRYVVLFYYKADDACPDQLTLLTMEDDRLVPKFVPPGGGCTQPLIPTAYAVSIDRATVPHHFIAVLPEFAPEGPGYEEIGHEVDLNGS